MKMTQAPDDNDHSHTVGTCDECGGEIHRFRGESDITCPDLKNIGCAAEYNCFGQRLRANWRSNPSNYDDEIGDMEGFEIAEAQWEALTEGAD